MGSSAKTGYKERKCISLKSNSKIVKVNLTNITRSSERTIANATLVFSLNELTKGIIETITYIERSMKSLFSNCDQYKSYSAEAITNCIRPYCSNSAFDTLSNDSNGEPPSEVYGSSDPNSDFGSSNS